MKKGPGFWGGLIAGLLIALAAVIVVLFGESIHNIILGRTDVVSSEDSILSPAVQEKVDLLNDYIDYYYLDYKEDDNSGETAEDRAEGMYKGLVESLNDDYSEYYTAKEYSRFSESKKGYFAGIGVNISSSDEGYFYVSGFTSDDSPAKAAGVEIEDIFYKVDGEVVLGADISDLVDKVRGEEGTEVVLTMLRGEDREEVEFTVKRGIIEATTVSHNMLEKDTGYIIVGIFDTITSEQFEAAYEDLKEQGMKSLIIDLRGNSGGMVDAAVKIADKLLPPGVVTYTLDSRGKRHDYNAVTPEKLDIPLVVLVDSGSASASELLTGAVKDYGIGTVVGTTTYGKGIVQNIYPLQDGSAIKLTNSRYYTPNGINIQGTGIEPDVKVELDVEQYKKGTDNQLKKAIEVVNSSR